MSLETYQEHMRENVGAEKYKMKSESECHLTEQFNPGIGECSCPKSLY